MTASRSARQKNLQEMAGPLGLAQVRPGRGDTLRYSIRCLTDHGPDKGERMAGETYRAGKSNTRRDAINRWVLHLAHSHPEADPPCMRFLDEARDARAAERRAEREAMESVQQMLRDLAHGEPVP